MEEISRKLETCLTVKAHPSSATTYEKELIQRTLEIPEILEAIMENLDKNSLQASRCVSRNWNSEARKKLRRCGILFAGSQEVLQEFKEMMTTFVEGISLTVQQLFLFRITEPGSLKSSLSSVKHHVKVLGLSLYSNWASLEEITQLIYNSLPHLEELLVGVGELFLYGNVLREFSHEDLPYPIGYQILPPLRQISIDVATPGVAIVEEEFWKAQKQFNTFYKMLLASAVNLKCLKLRTWDTRCKRKMQEDVISSITSFELEKIEMENLWASEDNISSLLTHQLDFPLKNLKLDVSSSEVDLKSLLSRFCSSLVELQLRINDKGTYYNFPFVHMKKLKTLILIFAGNQFWIDWGMLPQLERLELKGCTINGIFGSMLSNSSHPGHLKTLHMDNARFTPDMYPLVNQVLLSHVNSRLTYLQLKVRPEWTPPFALLFKECTRLQHLTVYSDADTPDEQLCGVTTLDQLSTNWPKDRRKQARLDIAFRNLVAHVKRLHSAPNFRQFPFLGSLQDLQILELYGNFSELAILHGVVHCSNLRKLYIASEQMNEERAMGVIRQGGLVHLTSVQLNARYVNHLP